MSRVRTGGFSLSDLTQTFKNAKTLLNQGNDARIWATNKYPLIGSEHLYSMKFSNANGTPCQGVDKSLIDEIALVQSLQDFSSNNAIAQARLVTSFALQLEKEAA